MAGDSSKQQPSVPVHRDPFPFAAALLAVAVFAAVGASLGLLIATGTLSHSDLAQFHGKNALAAPARSVLFRALVAGGALFSGIAIIHVALRGRAGVPLLGRTANLLLPLGLSFLLPSLFAYEPWHKEPLVYLVELGVAVLLLEQALRRSLAAIPLGFIEFWSERFRLSPRLSRLLPLSLVVLGGVAYAIYFSHYTILHHHRLKSSGFDLGINVNWCWNALHGHPERSTVLFGRDGGHFLGNHAIFGMALWLPFYAIAPGAESLLIVQATMAGAAAIPLYLFASTQIPRMSAVVVAYAYLMFAPLHGPNFYDFHELIPPLFFHFLLYWAIAREKNWLVWLLVPVLWSFREDVAVGIVVLGCFLAVTGIRPRMGMVMAGVSAVWFVILKFVVMPMFWQSWFANIYKDLQAPGASGYGTVVQTILVNPSYFLSTMLKEDKVIYFLHMFAPLAFLPARRPALLLLAIPGFAFSLLTTGYAPTLSIAFQYTCHTIPYVFASSVLMLRLLGQRAGGLVARRAALGAIVLGVASHSYVFGAVLQHNTFVGGFQKVEFTMTREEQRRYRVLQRMKALIPPNASVAATENEVPHVAARMDAYTLKDSFSEAEYVLVSKVTLRLGRTQANLREMFSRADYGLLLQGEDLYLFKRGHKSSETAAVMKALDVAQRAKTPTRSK